jgi:TusA-related sulfurtransferase
MLNFIEYIKIAGGRNIMVAKTVQKSVDCTNMTCPKPSLMAKKVARELAPGQTAEMVVDLDAFNRVVDIVMKQGARVVDRIKNGKIGRVLFTKD